MADGNPDSLIPWTGTLDLRSEIDTGAKGSVRWRQNFRSLSKTQIQRRPQFRRFLASLSYNNEDLHDQLVALRRKFNIREPLLNVYADRTTDGSPVLFAATGSSIYAFTVSNWLLIGDSFGTGASGSPRWSIGMNEDYAIFTNGLDAPVYYPVGLPNQQPGLGMQTFADLALIGLTQAKVTWEWRGITFFADVTMNAQRCSYRLVWSNFQNPTSFDPSVVGTLAGYQDLNSWETILAGASYGNGFLIYTTHGIWSMTPNPGAQPTFSFTRLYGFDSDSTSRLGCIKYRNSLVQAGQQHLYIADDNVYAFNPFYSRPQIADWINQSAVKMIDEIDASNCDNVVSGMWGHEAWFSYPSIGGNGLPDTTLVLNTQYSAADYIDYGFLDFASYYPDGSESLRQFIIQNGICDEQGLVDLGYPYGNEGISEYPTPAPAFTPTCIYTNKSLTIGGVTVEDYTQPNPDPDSLCALLALGDDPTASCQSPCEPEEIFLGISASDWCLKDIGNTWYRETCQNPSATGAATSLGYESAAGSYSLDGFDSILRFVGGRGKDPNQDIHCSKAELGYNPKVANPTTVGMRIGQAAQEADPNDVTAPIKWNQFSEKPLGVLFNPAAGVNVRPATTCQWNFVMSGHYLFFEFKVSGTGGAATFTRATVTGTLRDIRNR